MRKRRDRGIHVRPVFAMVALTVLAICAGVVSVPTAVTSQASVVPADSRPNVILITTDDQAATDLAWMPKTRAAIGSAGVTFRQGISPHPLCCPARAEMLTGQYAQNNGVYTNRGVYGGYGHMLSPDNTVASWLKDSGYRTGLVGKFMNGYRYGTHGRPKGWTFWDPTINGTYNYFDYVQANNGFPTASNGKYITDYVAETSRDLITQWADEPEPFFLWASYVAPHKSCLSEVDGVSCSAFPRPEPDYADAFPTARNPARSKSSYNEKNVSDKPRVVRRQAKKDSARLDNFFRARIRSLASVDDAVADTVAALEEAGELDNTLIIFTSDNGWVLGEHRYVGKKLAFEESLRVPFLMSGPGVPAGGLRDQTVSVLDIAPTIVDVAGVSPGRLMDGTSLMRFVDDPSTRGRQTRLIQSGHITSRQGARLWDYRGVREKRYTYTRWASGFEELYDRRRDPHQLVNVARDPAYRKVRREMWQRLRVLRGCAGVGECYRWFDNPPKPAQHTNRVGFAVGASSVRQRVVLPDVVDVPGLGAEQDIDRCAGNCRRIQ
jgi:N-acetylglucosamine-6-sulfatase